MAKIMRIGISFVLVLLAAGSFPGPPPAKQTVPYQEPSLFLRTAAAAPFWSDWLSGPPTRLEFDEFYSKASALGLSFSDKLQRLQGRRIQITGFMAPPLKPTLSFFVLTQTPMSICPFCSSDADWPSNIVVVTLPEPLTALPFDQPVTVTGILELGSQLDEETGFVSLVRIRADDVEKSE
ncbi:hypothetical protein [Sporomusa termitida]|uniref:DUF3299 domain-containing protein n=1 Tax=Sporomusa termitida TaxID=2377 RepID=A0A517DUE9_9FIRM|nr:hypothetical protein [Sporomusa termitida]QDR80971.1 hypothetical protein SPTER_23140 [Sporomusa termitida]